MTSHIDYVIKVLVESKTNSNYVEINLPQDLLCRVVNEATELLLAQPMLLELRAPINICGDIHGMHTYTCSLLSLNLNTDRAALYFPQGNIRIFSQYSQSAAGRLIVTTYFWATT